MKKLITYTLPRRFKDMNIPINIQSCYLREYAQKKNLIYVLPQTEVIKKDCFFKLDSLINNKSKDKNLIGITSIFMLPYNDLVLLTKLLKQDKILNLEWHFPFESIICNSEKIPKILADFKEIEYSKMYFENL